MAHSRLLTPRRAASAGAPVATRKDADATPYAHAQITLFGAAVAPPWCGTSQRLYSGQSQHHSRVWVGIAKHPRLHHDFWPPMTPASWLRVAGLVALPATYACSDDFLTPTQDLTIATVGWPDTIAVGDTAGVSVRLAIDGRDDGVGLPEVDWSSSDDEVLRVMQATAKPGHTSWDTLTQKLQARVEATGPGTARLQVSVRRGSEVFVGGSFLTVTQRWTSVSASWSGPSQIGSAATHHTCAISSIAETFCWGETAPAVLGSGISTSSLVPAPVPNLPGLTAITAGGSFSCGTAAVGFGLCWGSNAVGEIGDGSQVTRYLVSSVEGGILFTSLHAGGNFACGTEADGGVYCWGFANLGQLGRGGGPHDSVLSVCSTMIPTVIYCETTPSLVRIGRFLSSTQFEDYCTEASSIHTGCTFSVSSLSVGLEHACGIAPAGAAFCWGSNDRGQIGGPVLDDLCTELIGGPCSMTPAIVGAADTTWAVPSDSHYAGGVFESVSAGGKHSCGIRHDGHAMCWGAGSSGQLGNGSFVDASAPFTVVNAPTFTSVHAGGDYTCALTPVGEVFCWGASYGGEATKISGALEFTMISSGWGHACGVTRPEGAIYCWGNNDRGQLGTGTRTSTTTPTRVAKPLGTRSAAPSGPARG